MDAIRQTIRVSFAFPVHFTTGVFRAGNPLFRDLVAGDHAGGTVPGVLFVVDGGVARAHPDLVRDIERYALQHADAFRLARPVLVVPGGERAKNDPAHLAEIHDAIHEAGLCRHSYVAAVGGGAVLDAAGYAAATAHRGIRLIRVPTTVLAQDDSAVGVKNGVNAFGQKNYLGTFAPPFAVINDSGFLRTLSDRDWRAGLSEAVKAALIRDPDFLAFIEVNAARLLARDLRIMEQVIHRSATIHLQHIATGGDPFELGSSRPLDFGHWAAHKLEQLTANRLRHGEAVAIGIALDSTCARVSGLLPEADWRRIVRLLTALELPVYATELEEHLEPEEHPRSVLRGLDEFRQHLGGRLTVMMLRAIGDPVDVHDIDRAVLVRAVQTLKALEQARPAGAARAS